MTAEQQIQYHRVQMAEWLRVLYAAREVGDSNMERQAIRERRIHREALLCLWASPLEQLAACV
ncbi:hypothetical protein [Paenibacillus wynnii]|uniref:Uncharacterized protein n=1 Tax=Paenibacillus wynnii TaxID=268407 RepID=A0A098MDM9_9BACL|nr:hypothetical protein [Paenibacillus wynnii]KGE20674.1 hypothetical protein PWYN_00280 [Paenibacillus wynnii]